MLNHELSKAVQMMGTTMAHRAQQGSRRGFTVIELLIVIMVIAIVASLAIPNYMTSKKAANESSAIGSMRALVAAEENYRLAKSSSKYADLAALNASKLINPKLGSGAHSGYTFITDGAPDANSFAFKGVPQDHAGDRYFFVDQSGVIRTSETATIGATSPPLK